MGNAERKERTTIEYMVRKKRLMRIHVGNKRMKYA